MLTSSWRRPRRLAAESRSLIVADDVKEPCISYDLMALMQKDRKSFAEEPPPPLRDDGPRLTLSKSCVPSSEAVRWLKKVRSRL